MLRWITVHRLLVRNFIFTTHSGTCKRLKSTSSEVLGQREMSSHKTEESTREKFLMFAYGTLKEGQPNYKHMLDPKTGNAQLVAKGYTRQKFPLVIAGNYNIPYLLYCPGEGHQVTGDVYSVDSQKLDFLDDFEAHPTYYERMEDDIIIFTEEKGETRTLRCWVYFLKNYKDEMLDLTRYANYDSYGSHGLQYVESEKTVDLSSV